MIVVVILLGVITVGHVRNERCAACMRVLNVRASLLPTVFGSNDRLAFILPNSF